MIRRYCFLGTCSCLPGYTGRYCESHCPPNFFGNNCKNECKCQNGATCNPINGIMFYLMRFRIFKLFY